MLSSSLLSASLDFDCKTEQKGLKNTVLIRKKAG